MAKGVAFVATEMPDLTVWYGYVVSYSSIKIVIDDLLGHKTIYRGNFKYDTFGNVSGTLDEVHEFRSGTKIYKVTDMNVSAAKMYKAIQILGDAQLAARIALSKSDVLVGSTGDDHVRAYSGTDKVRGLGGDDILEGMKGTDKLYGGSGDDSLFGGKHGDNLFGGSGQDALSGGSGNDKLQGQNGADFLTGGGGADKFIFKKAVHSDVSASDTITDFNAAQGDIINLKRIDAKQGVSGDQSFDFIGAAAFSGTQGELQYVAGVISGDTDGDGLVDFSIAIANFAAIDEFSFIL